MNGLQISQLLDNQATGSNCNDCSKVQQFNNAQPNGNPCNPSLPSRQIPNNPVDQPVYQPEQAGSLPSTIPEPIAQQYQPALPSDYSRWKLAGPLGPVYNVAKYPMPSNNPTSSTYSPPLNPYFTNNAYPSAGPTCDCVPPTQAAPTAYRSSALPQLLLMNQYAVP